MDGFLEFPGQGEVLAFGNPKARGYLPFQLQGHGEFLEGTDKSVIVQIKKISILPHKRDWNFLGGGEFCQTKQN